MTLIEAIRDLNALDEESTIYAAEPWTKDSMAIVAYDPDPMSGRLPIEAERLGLQYFLEVSIARTVVEDWITIHGTEPTLEQKCAEIITYAINDA